MVSSLLLMRGSDRDMFLKKLTVLVIAGGIATLNWNPALGAALKVSEPEIVEREKFYVIGPGEKFTVDTVTQVLGRIWAAFGQRFASIPNMTPGLSYGLTYQETTDKGIELTYIAGYEVASLKNIPSKMLGKEIPASTYLKFTYIGPLSGAPTFTQYVHNTWVPQSKYTKATTPDFELYGSKYNSMRPNNPTNQYDLYLSIVPPKKKK